MQKTRTLALLVAAWLIVASLIAPAAATAWTHASPRLLVVEMPTTWWSWLLSGRFLATKEGVGMDPDGAPVLTHPSPTPLATEAGAAMDPDGVATKEGADMDPDG